MSGHVPQHSDPAPGERREDGPLLFPAARRRRAAAARARRKRLLRIDIALALLLALATLVLAPGLAMVALIALGVLVLCALSLVVERLRARRTLRRAASRDAAGAARTQRPRALP